MYNCWQEDGHFLIQLELCAMTLTKLIKTTEVMHENLVKRILHEVCSGLSQIHEHDIVHMDIKPDNILIGFDHNLKIGDFGSAVLKNKKDVDTSESDCCYIAPELFQVHLFLFLKIY